MLHYLYSLYTNFLALVLVLTRVLDRPEIPLGRRGEVSSDVP